VLNTGTGLIYPDIVPATVPVLPASGSIPPVPGLGEWPRSPSSRRQP
jgi:hypothetical protein